MLYRGHRADGNKAHPGGRLIIPGASPGRAKAHHDPSQLQLQNAMMFWKGDPANGCVWILPLGIERHTTTPNIGVGATRNPGTSMPEARSRCSP